MALSFLLALSLCLPMLFTAFAAGETTGSTGEDTESVSSKYTSLYANKEDLVISFSADNCEDGNVPTTLTDALGNNFSVGAGAIFEDGALLNRGAVLDFTEAQGTKLNGKSYTYEFVFGYEDTVAVAAGGLAGALYGLVPLGG